MNKHFVALAIGASLFSAPALAQTPDHGAHHPAPPAAEQAEPMPGPGHSTPGMSGGGGMRGMDMQGMGMHGAGMHGAGMHGTGMHGTPMHGMGMRGTGMSGAGMMNCPMMQGMQGMRQAPGMQMQGHAGPAGDQSVSSIALNAVNEKMHRDMAIAFTGDADVDFARAMIAHHRGAVDMARVVLAFGEDERIRSLATSVIETQEEEIRVMEAWLAERGAQ